MSKMTRVKANGKRFTIKSKKTASGVKFPFSDEKDWTKHNKHIVEVCNDEKDVCTKFNYYTSHSDWEKGLTEMSDKDRKYAFRTLLDEGISGMNDFDEFCGDFGYDPDSKKAHKMWKSLQKQTEKALIIVDSEAELYDILNDLSEQGIE